jgi:hypothetical protein
MKKRTSFILVLIVIAGLSFLPRRRSAEAKQFCSLPFAQRESAFLTYPVEKQYRLYLSVDDEPACDMDSESPSNYLAWGMAEGDDNNKTASYLADRLREEDDEDVQRDIIFALRAIATKGKLRGRNDVAEIVMQKSSEMRGSFLDRLSGDGHDAARAREFSREIEDYTR